jgi:hypothetical protein
MSNKTQRMRNVNITPEQITAALREYLLAAPDEALKVFRAMAMHLLAIHNAPMIRTRGVANGEVRDIVVVTSDPEFAEDLAYLCDEYDAKNPPQDSEGPEGPEGADLGG